MFNYVTLLINYGLIPVIIIIILEKYNIIHRIFSLLYIWTLVTRTTATTLIWLYISNSTSLLVGNYLFTST